MTKQDLDVKNILLIMPEDMVKKYKRRFLHEGFICKAVDSGFYALTMLEREKPSLIIATEEIEDLEIVDLLEIIEIDSDLAETGIIVLSENLEASSNERCLTLDKDSDFEDVLAAADKLLEIHAGEAEETIPEGVAENVTMFNDDSAELNENLTDGDSTGPDTFDDTYNTQITGHRPTDTRFDTTGAQITGDLATDQLIEMIKTFSMGSRGLLIVRTSTADGRLLLEHERLLKAEYNKAEGKGAFDALLFDALNESKVSYFFQRYDNASSSKGSKGKGVALSYLLKTSGQPA